MLSWALLFLIVALVGAVFGFGVMVGTAVGVAKLLFFVALALLLASLVSAAARQGAPPA